ncbi:hypothetical protein SDC9_186422 [bioreactor metagenome]|uniref:Uncharacterized protein n=1 Tax=bioreactor metagenome TaxID=1076179 RepID=A0A645HIW1_9ZZZZ
MAARPALASSFLSAAKSGSTPSTVSGWSSSRPSQGDPLWRLRAISTCSRARPSACSTGASSSSEISWESSEGASKNRAPCALQPIAIRPFLHSCSTCSGLRGCPPWASQAWQLPSVGWPAKASSPAGVKIRSW